MFRTAIGVTPLTSEGANDFFQNIRGDSFNGDNSLVATLRALIAPRIPDGESMYARFSCVNRSAESIESAIANSKIADMVRYLSVSDGMTRGTISIISVNSPMQENNEAAMNLLSQHFTGVFKDYHKLEAVTNLFRKNFYVLCFINPGIKNTVIFVQSLNIRKLHILQSAILGMLPWYFNPADGISELESELIYSFREPTSEKYEACIAKFAEKYDFESARIKKMLSNFEKQYERRELDATKRNIEEINREINRLNNQIGDHLNSLNEEHIRLLGLEAKIANDDGESEIMDYFLCNKKLVLEEVHGNELYFTVRDYLTYYDEEVVQRCIDNRHSFVYTENHGNITDSQMKKLMIACFIDQKIKIRFCAAYRFSMNGNVAPRGRIEAYAEGCETYMPNPHIHAYNCMGNYTRAINDFLRKRDYIGAFEQTIASAKSLNWCDSPVMTEFFRVLNGTSNYCRTMKCFELPDGSVVEPMKAIEWIENEEKKEKNVEE